MTEVLNLSTIVEKHSVNITSKLHPTGRSYELMNVDDLGIVALQTIDARHAESRELQKPGKQLTEAEARTVRKALGDIVKILLPAIEPKVLEGLSNAKRTQVLMAWSSVNTPAQPVNPPKPQTGAASSRASKGSSAATRKPGSTRRSGS